MKEGDLVRNIFTEEIGLITGFDDSHSESDYVNVIFRCQEWLVPIDHLEVINEASTCKLDTQMI